AADLGGIAEATALVTSIPAAVCVPIYPAVLTSMLMWTSYRTIAHIFKWLTLVRGAYLLTAFLTHVDWYLTLQSTFVPRIEFTREFFHGLGYSRIRELEFNLVVVFLNIDDANASCDVAGISGYRPAHRR